MRVVKLSRFIVAAIAGLSMFGAASAQQLKDVTIALPSKSMVAYRPLIAYEMGLFEKRELNPEFVYVGGVNVTAATLLSGEADYAVTTPAVVIQLQMNGQAVVQVANNYGGFSGTLVLSKSAAEKLGTSPDASITDRLMALDGLVIASTSPSSNLTTGYKASANAIGSNPTFTYMDFSAMVAALQSGAVDGIVATSPMWTIPVINDFGVMWISAPKGEIPKKFTPVVSASLAATLDFVQANPELTAAVTGVYEDLSKAVMERPNEVKAALAKLFPEVSQASLDLVLSTEATAMAAGPITVENMIHEFELLKINGVVPESAQIDPAALLWPRP